jgi:enolase
MSKITSIQAREILDSRGNPTIEVEVKTSSGNLGRAAVPSGASTGAHEACELRDEEKNRYLGKGVRKAVANVKEKIAPKLKDFSVEDQAGLDKIMIELDGTENKTNLGANAILGVSLAAARAASLDAGQLLYQYVGRGNSDFKLPVPLMNVLNGGAHANNGLDIQEFMIVPLKSTFSESLRAGAEIFHTLKKILGKKGMSTAVGDEGGFAPKLANNEEALKLLMEAIEGAGYHPGKDVYLGLDVAATELLEGENYRWDGKKISGDELIGIYQSWTEKYPLITIEDGFSEDDWASWKKSTDRLGKKTQLVGDDLFVTNPKRLQKGITDGVANALLVKVNQIGTLTETAAAVKLAQKNTYRTVMSHRSGETEDSTISDLAVAMGSQQIKTGGLCRSDRIAKYNQLLRIEESLGSNAKYWGKSAFAGLN